MLQTLSKEALHGLTAHEGYFSKLMEPKAKCHGFDYRLKHKRISERIEVLEQSRPPP